MLFIDNKYTRVYYNIVIKAQNRILSEDTYTETHHIIPKSLGGSNAIDNLVVLTAREHFICHWLLTKMTTGKNKAKMFNAASMMTTNQNTSQVRYTSRLFEKLRSEWAKQAMTNEVRIKISNTLTGRKRGPQSNELKEKRAAALRGLKRTNEQKQRMSEAQLNRNYTPSEETCNKHSKRMSGAGNPMYGVTRDRTECPHCHKLIAEGMYSRWHGDNCKLNPN